MTTHIKLAAPTFGGKGEAQIQPGWHRLNAARRQKLARDFIAALRNIETQATKEVDGEAGTMPVLREMTR